MEFLYPWDVEGALWMMNIFILLASSNTELQIQISLHMNFLLRKPYNTNRKVKNEQLSSNVSTSIDIKKLNEII